MIKVQVRDTLNKFTRAFAEYRRDSDKFEAQDDLDRDNQAAVDKFNYLDPEHYD